MSNARSRPQQRGAAGWHLVNRQPTLRDQLAQHSRESDDGIPETSKRQRLSFWRRLISKLLFVEGFYIIQRVLNHWERIALEMDAAEQQQQHPHQEPAAARGAASAKKWPQRQHRRQDLCYVGNPFPPTARKYPVDRMVCRHRHSDQDNSTMLRAWGGKGKVGTPLHLWVCQGCGARWERIGDPQGTLGSSSSSRAGAQYPIAPVGNPIAPFNEQQQPQAATGASPQPPSAPTGPSTGASHPF